ncbi:MAG: hypothetical protein JNL38_09635 [Myxococcales bacterium]|nr:hypothetical protein [Myxococcales bacterium]
MRRRATPKNDPIAALRALRVLYGDPDALPKVFEVIESLPGRAPARMLERARATADGRALLRDKPDLRALLSDRERLLAMPPGSLGRAYADFTEREGISADGIVQANEAARRGEVPDVDPDLLWLGDRMRDTHDLWHVVTGYGADVVGEVALLAFSYAQTRHVGVALVCSLALVRGLPVSGVARRAFRAGSAAAWLPAVRWESLLALPLADVRAKLRVEPAPAYERVTSADLRARGAIPAARAA